MSNFNDSFLYRVCSDFIDQLWYYIERYGSSLPMVSSCSGITETRLNEILEYPELLSVQEAISLSEAFRLKCGLVLYDAGDNSNGPISTAVFTECWERQGKPNDEVELNGVN